MTFFQKITVLLGLGLLLAGAAHAQKDVRLEFEVDGVCGMCKERIENAALIKGVKFAEWDKETQILQVVYRPKKVTELDIHRAVAEMGHDTPKVKATKEAYQKLPACCAYRDGVDPH